MEVDPAINIDDQEEVGPVYDEYMGNSIIKGMLQNILAGAQNEQPTMQKEPVNSRLEEQLAYTRSVESGSDRNQVNRQHRDRPTTGSYHIEQPTFAEALQNRGDSEGFKYIKNLKPEQYLKHIQSNPEQEHEIAKDILERKIQKWGSNKIVDVRGDTVPAWRAAYSHGDYGLFRHLRKTHQLGKLKG